MKNLEITYEKPENLIPYVNNNKIHSDDQILRLASSIQAYGFDQSIVVDKNKVIIKGHARREAAIKLKLKQVPIIIRDDLNENEVKAARIADNKTASTEYNNDALKLDLGFLNSQDFNINLTGIQPFELDQLMKDNVIDDNFQRSVIGDFQNTGMNAPNPVVGEVKIVPKDGEFPDLNTEDPKYQSASFVLSLEQIDLKNRAIEMAKSKEDFSHEENQNENGNALAAIMRHYVNS